MASFKKAFRRRTCQDITCFIVINVAVSVNLKIPEFLCALSLLGGILGPSPLLLEHFPIHLSPTELGCSVIQAVCYHLGFSAALPSPSVLRFPSLAVSSPGRGVNGAAARSSGRENSTRQDWTGQSRTAFIRLKKTPTKPQAWPSTNF